MRRYVAFSGVWPRLGQGPASQEVLLGLGQVSSGTGGGGVNFFVTILVCNVFGVFQDLDGYTSGCSLVPCQRIWFTIISFPWNSQKC